MPSRMVHYCIGNEILKSVRLNSNLFTIGNLSPDAHDSSLQGNASAHYKTAYKIGVDKYPVVDLEAFKNKYLLRAFDDFILGYYCHLITDNIWSHSTYYEYLECDENERKSRVAKCYKDYVTLNKILLDHFSLNKVVLEIPNHVSIEEITVVNLTRVIEGLYHDFDSTYMDNDLTILSFQFIIDFIKSATENCLREINKLIEKG